MNKRFIEKMKEDKGDNMSAKEEKVYKLLIESEIEVPKAYKKYLKPREFVRGEEVKFKFYVVNIGEEKFLGGLPSLLKYKEFGSVPGLGSLEVRVREDKLLEMRVPILEKGQRHQFGEWILTPLSEGFGEIELGIKAENGGKVLHFRFPEEEGRDAWRFAFVVINRELLQALNLLEELTKSGKNEGCLKEE